MNTQIEDLRDQINKQKEEIKIAEFLLKTMESQEKANMTFAETTLGKGWYGMVSKITTPFHKAFLRAQKQLTDPKTVQVEKLQARAQYLLSFSSEINREKEPKRAHSLAVKMAKLTMDLEAIYQNSSLIPSLRDEIARLRDPEKQVESKKMMNQLEDLFQTLEKKVGNNA